MEVHAGFPNSNFCSGRIPQGDYEKSSDQDEGWGDVGGYP